KSVAVGSAAPPGENARIFLVALENAEKRKLTFPPAGSSADTDPQFSPDGRTLAFIRWWNRAGDIYLQNASAAEARRLTFDQAIISGLAWTPDGRYIVFSSSRSGLPTLWKVPASGGAIEPLAGVGEEAYSPAVSRRGDLLAYRKWEVNGSIWGIRLAP